MSKDVVYIFISHSHYDIDKVRPIRNYLESIGAEPILFFLKSKTDADEIEQLIKDEIDARVWFIYCRSSNAEASTWVKKEREYVKFKGKRNITIDIDSGIDRNGNLTKETKEKLNRIVSNFRSLQKLYISYSHLDIDIARRIHNQIKIYGIDLDVFSDEDCLVGYNWERMIMNAIIDSQFYLLLLSKRSINSRFIEDEHKLAKSKQKRMIPVIIYENEESKEEILNSVLYKRHLADQHCLLFDASNDEQIDNSVNRLISELVKIVFRED